MANALLFLILRVYLKVIFFLEKHMYGPKYPFIGGGLYFAFYSHLIHVFKLYETCLLKYLTPSLWN